MIPRNRNGGIEKVKLGECEPQWGGRLEPLWVIGAYYPSDTGMSPVKCSSEVSTERAKEESIYPRLSPSLTEGRPRKC